MGFTKLDEKILQSSIMAENPSTFKIWISLLAACKESGIAYVSPIYLSTICHIPLENVKKAIHKLSEPDELSRSLTDDGRRIRRVDGGFEIINYHIYRAASLRSAEAERKRLYRKEQRECPDKPGRSPDASASASSSLILEIIKYLNTKTGKAFRAESKETVAFIKARLAEGRTVEDFKKVIDTKVQKWANDPKMADFLRPSTLFRPANFEAYLNERPVTQQKSPTEKTREWAQREMEKEAAKKGTA